MLKEVRWSEYVGKGAMVWGFIEQSNVSFCSIEETRHGEFSVHISGIFTAFGINGNTYQTLEDAKQGIIDYMGNVLMKIALKYLDENAITAELRKKKISRL
jgi:hypothetical protein